MHKTFLKIILIIILVLNLHPDSAGQIQSRENDILVELSASTVDTTRLSAFMKLCWDCRFAQPLKGLEYGYDGLALARKMGDGKSMAVLHNYIGVIAIKINSLGKAKSHMQIAYQLADSLDVPAEKAYALNNIGEIFNLSGKPDSAIAPITEAIRIFKSIQHMRGLAYAYNQMGFSMRRQQNVSEAIRYHTLALETLEKLNRPFGVVGAYQNLGMDLLTQNRFAEARSYFEKMDPRVIQLQTNFSLSTRQILIGKTYQGENQFQTAIRYYLQGYRIADSAGLQVELRDAAMQLSNIFNRLNDYKSALKYFTVYNAMDDSIKSSNMIAEYKQLEMRKKFDEKYEYLEYKMQQENQLNELKLYWSKQVIYGFVAFSVIVLVFLIILIRNVRTIAGNNRLLTAHKNDIVIKNKELHAQNLQISVQNKSIIQQRDELELANATKDKFFSIIAHDLRGPVGSFSVFINLIIENYQNEINPEMMSLFQEVNASAQQTYVLLENLLMWARLQKGAIAYVPADNSLYNLADNNIRLLQAIANKKNLTISNLLTEKAVCEFDYYMIDTVMRNLLSNAIKFSHQNGAIGIYSKRTVGMIEITVSDSGTGMNQASLDKLFRIDIRHSSKEGTSGEKGTGLGLILCKEFIETHKGTIWADSQEGKGSEFHFTIPCADDQDVNNKTLRKAPAFTASPIPENLFILIAEDDDISYAFLSKTLASISKKILRAKTGLEAVDACRNNPEIDLALIDIKMPVMDGYEATRLIREFNTGLIMIAQTSYALAGDKEKAMKAGFSDHISKPIQKSLLMEVIQKLLANQPEISRSIPENLPG